MDTRRPLAAALLAVVVVSTGCLGGPVNAEGNTTSTASPSDTPDTVDIPAYPDFPSSLTNQTVLNYTKHFERASAYRRMLAQSNNSSGTLTDVQVSFISASVKSPKTNAYLVRMEYALGTTVSHSGQPAVAGDRRVSAAYYVNETTVLRSAINGPEPAPDPQTNGTSVSQP